MIIKDNVIYAEEGYMLRRIADKEIVGTEYWLGYIYYLNGEILPEKKLEVPEDFEEISIAEIETQERIEKQKQYSSLVEQYIRERYTASDEFAIQRQRDTNIEKFNQYFTFCEYCKSRAKQELGL